MSIDSPALTAELRRLRKGRAMNDAALLSRLGPQVMTAFDLAPTDAVPTIRRKARARVKRLLSDDHERLRTAALAALGLMAQADQKLLTDREAWLARELNCDARTARRRVSAAMRALVDALVEDYHARDLPPAPSHDGYIVRKFRATIRLDTARPELHEYRTIQVTTDRLGAIISRLTVPRSQPGAQASEIEVRSLVGGQVSERQRRSPEHFEFTVELPRLFTHGATHEYGLAFTIPEGQPMRPHYVFQPLVPCEKFELTARFDPARMPTDVWLLDGVAPRLLDDTGPGTSRLTPHGDGTLRLAFTDLRQGLAYGIRWSTGQA